MKEAQHSTGIEVSPVYLKVGFSQDRHVTFPYSLILPLSSTETLMGLGAIVMGRISDCPQNLLWLTVFHSPRIP